MLAFAGVPFIMGNACAELKAQGWPVTLSSDESGVAAAIEKVLGHPSWVTRLRQVLLRVLSSFEVTL